MKHLPFILLVIVLISACAPTDEQIRAAIKKTENAAATETARVPTKTITPTVTDTSIPTNTVAPSFTPKPTKTNTPTPTITSTLPPPPEQTATAFVLNATSTQTARIATATEIAKYKQIDWRELINYPDNHIGEFVVIRGRVFNVVNDSELQIYVAGTYEAVYISMRKSFSGIYEDQSVTVYGTVSGTHCFKNSYNADICQPRITGNFFGK